MADKKGKLKVAKSTLKRMILDRSVDEDGNKVSDRVLWSDETFMNKTGMYKVDKYTGEQLHASLGTISYYKKILGLNAESVFEYHQFVTGLIDPLVLFDEWNLKSNVKSIEDGVLSEKSKRTALIRDFELKDTKLYSTYTLAQLEGAIIALYEAFDMDGEAELKAYYKKRK